MPSSTLSNFPSNLDIAQNTPTNQPTNRVPPTMAWKATWSANFRILATPPRRAAERTPAVILLVTRISVLGRAFRSHARIAYPRPPNGWTSNKEGGEGNEVEDGIGIANIPPPTLLSIPSIFPRPSFPRPLDPYTRADHRSNAAIQHA